MNVQLKAWSHFKELRKIFNGRFPCQLWLFPSANHIYEFDFRFKYLQIFSISHYVC